MNTQFCLCFLLLLFLFISPPFLTPSPPPHLLYLLPVTFFLAVYWKTWMFFNWIYLVGIPQLLCNTCSLVWIFIYLNRNYLRKKERVTLCRLLCVYKQNNLIIRLSFSFFFKTFIKSYANSKNIVHLHMYKIVACDI